MLRSRRVGFRRVGFRRAGFLGAGLLAGAVFTGCASPATPVPAAATGSAGGVAAPAAGTSAPSAGSGADLSAGLLPADAFGQGAVVRTFSSADLSSWERRGDGPASVVPPECRTALDQATAQFADVEDAAGRVARAGGVRSFEVLAVPSSQVDAVAQVQEVVDACGSASFTHDGDHHGNAQVRVEPLEGVPDGMAAFGFTFSGSWSGGTWSATSLMGVAQDGDRVLTLTQTSWDDGNGGSPDPASFTALLQHAYEVQADALD